MSDTLYPRAHELVKEINDRILYEGQMCDPAALIAKFTREELKRLPFWRRLFICI